MNLNDLTPLLPLVAGPATSMVVEAARRVPVVPFDPKTVAGMRVAVVVASGLAGFGLAWLNGDLASFDVQGALKAIVDAAVVYAGAVATHDHLLARPQKAA